MKNLIKKLDKAFSTYIRLRDANDKGECKCISCSTVDHWKFMDAGHFIPRSNMSTRYNEFNVNAQCKFCNQSLLGNIINYREELIAKYGGSKWRELLMIQHETKKYTKFELQIMIDHYTDLVKSLKKQKC